MTDLIAPNLKQLGGELLDSSGADLHNDWRVRHSFVDSGHSRRSVLLVTCCPGGNPENRPLFTIFDRGIDIIRSIPFIILIVLLIPPFCASGRYRFRRDGELRCASLADGAFLCASDRTVLSEIDHGLVEASAAMGFSPRQIISASICGKVFRASPAVTMITLVSFVGITAIAGAIGAGGIGDFAIRYGYQMGLPR